MPPKKHNLTRHPVTIEPKPEAELNPNLFTTYRISSLPAGYNTHQVIYYQIIRIFSIFDSKH